ncbi:CoxG family protein [Rhodovulum sp.]|uniref:CoxG family protein n=1 Tax=Rhodovulum sp. TaxID=34009 RepID=UPI0017A63B71|nr:carbon monoxide dehydrogenase subunit G [Rhodovulum sp.]HDR27741.1 carbon monoxide dehydrogenase [Rhodovulum sp.]
MELTGSRVIAADRAAVWERLTNPDTLKACIPGYQELEGRIEDGFEAVVTQKVGPVKATFRGAVTLSDLIERQSYTILGEGKGGVAGFAKGRADMRLEEAEGSGTELIYDVHAEVGGKLAQLGSRLIHGTARRLADQFFDTFTAEVEGPAAETQGEAATG